MQTFREVMDLWPDTATLASDVGAPPYRVRKWRERDSIPSPEWRKLIEAAEAKGYPVTADLLADLASRHDESRC